MTAPPGPAAPDLLVSGKDRPPWRPRAGTPRGTAAVAAALLAVVAGAAVVSGLRAEHAERQREAQAVADARVVSLALLRPGQDNAPRDGPRRPGLQVVVANTGPATVRLLWGTLVPGSWQVQVPPDRELRPGRSVMLGLTPPAACGTAQPQVLRVEALPAGGAPATAEFPLAGAQLAYGGRLADAVTAAARDCDPTARGSDGRTYPHRS